MSFVREGDSLVWKDTPPSPTRICALCLDDVPRDTYSEHMQGHGYETIELGFTITRDA